METSVLTSNNTTTTVQHRERKSRSEDDREYEDDDTSIKRIKMKMAGGGGGSGGSRQELLDLPGNVQSIMYSKSSKRTSRHSPFDTSSSNLKINEVQSTDFFSVESTNESSYHTATEQDGTRPTFTKLLNSQTVSGICHFRNKKN